MDGSGVDQLFVCVRILVCALRISDDGYSDVFGGWRQNLYHQPPPEHIMNMKTMSNLGKSVLLRHELELELEIH